MLPCEIRLWDNFQQQGINTIKTKHNPAFVVQEVLYKGCIRRRQSRNSRRGDVLCLQS